jgi:hypothetical protein
MNPKIKKHLKKLFKTKLVKMNLRELDARLSEVLFDTTVLEMNSKMGSEKHQLKLGEAALIRKLLVVTRDKDAKNLIKLRRKVTSI